ncbi:hemerythrin domain-containing protein [Ammonicoccus fulvus]|uniref:Hemerythrin domain-containing protein n=1 Tax=Ammonicoccus fulvus TaxID=3138240 RepID=A0ABZ3FN86_9ACTN
MTVISDPTISPPAGTVTMGIVHSALRRDLARARLVLSGAPGATRRAAIGRHLLWLIEWLHQHHEGEDTVLWPALLHRDPDLAPLLGNMETDHRAIQTTMATLERAARGLIDGSTTVADTLRALDEFSDLLEPHLAREEHEVMPEVARLLTQAEWEEIDREAWTGRMTPPELAATGLWVMDGLPAAERQIVLQKVSPLTRIVLRLLFTGPHLRRRAALWGGTPAASIGSLPAGEEGRPLRRTLGFEPRGSCSVVVAATPDQVYAVVSDPTRDGEWSHESQGSTWLDGATTAVPGARFRGLSRLGRVSWSQPCIVEVADPGRRFVFRTSGSHSARWSYELEPVGTGTRITQRFEIILLPRAREVALYLLIPSHRDRTTALTGDLESLGRVAATEQS